MHKHLFETRFWHELMHGIFGPRQGGARIIVDAEDAETGVGKTGLATALGQQIADIVGYDIGPEDFTLSGQEYLQRWREHPDKHQPSVLILDELAGAGAGDARRAMSNQNVNLGRSWQLMRKKRIISIVTLPHWSDAEKRMRRFANYRLWCLREPIGYFRPYRIGAGFDAGGTETHGLGEVDQIKFPNLDGHNDELYRYVSSLKDDLLESEYFDADEVMAEDDEPDGPDRQEMQRERYVERAIRYCKPWAEDGLTYEEAARKTGEDGEELIPRSVSWVGKRVREWKRGEHRDLVPEPDDSEEIPA